MREMHGLCICDASPLQMRVRGFPAPAICRGEALSVQAVARPLQGVSRQHAVRCKAGPFARETADGCASIEHCFSLVAISLPCWGERLLNSAIPAQAGIHRATRAKWLDGFPPSLE